ncbi:MAG: HAD hydrolase family protein, partial [Clostridiales bacterium]|nr:HAD hydrolase family protein [Clostridiales bacterium]
DDQDDIEPIRKCGLGVAVANAIPPVLDVADDIAESNDMDGVARFIEKRLRLSRSREGTPDERPS